MHPTVLLYHLRLAPDGHDDHINHWDLHYVSVCTRHVVFEHLPRRERAVENGNVLLPVERIIDRDVRISDREEDEAREAARAAAMDALFAKASVK